MRHERVFDSFTLSLYGHTKHPRRTAGKTSNQIVEACGKPIRRAVRNEFSDALKGTMVRSEAAFSGRLTEF